MFENRINHVSILKAHKPKNVIPLTQNVKFELICFPQCFFNLLLFLSAVKQKVRDRADIFSWWVNGDDVSVRLSTASRLSDALFSTLIKKKIKNIQTQTHTTLLLTHAQRHMHTTPTHTKLWRIQTLISWTK